MDSDHASDRENTEFRFAITPHILETLPPSHEFVYLLTYDLADHAARTGDSPVTLIRNLLSTGTIADAWIRATPDDLFAGLPDGPLRYIALYSTILGPDYIAYAANLSQDCILAVEKNRLSGSAAIVFDSAARSVTLIPSDSAETGQPAPAPPDDDDAPDITPDMIEQYILESDDLLEKTEHHLCCIPETPEKAGEHLAEALRLIHSFKGHSGLLGFRDFEQLSHKMESLLEYFRENTGNCDDAIRTLLLRGIDCLREGLSALSGDGSVPLPDIGPLVQMMDDARTAAGPSEPKQRPGKRRTSGEILRNMSARLSIDRRDIRVDLEKLDAMVNLVGELVIAESTVTKNPDLKGIPLDNFERSAHNLRRIISDLRHVVMSARMVPLAKTFRRMNRLVHDLSARSGKQIRLRLIGEETEVDKTVIERIVDPLVHLIRNSVDHGIESPEGRHRSGKPGTGTITLEAGHEGGEVLIRLSDDGRGLDREKILARAIGQGLISDDEARLTGQETDHLIFEPGFSTSEDVTDVSGRGIGLDVVRQNIEKLKGRTEVESTPDRGTTFCLRIPLTLAVIDGMLIRIGSACFTIPLLSIRKSFRPHRRQITVTMSGHEMVHIHNRLLPVIRLHRLYKIKPEHRALDAGILIHVTSGPKSVCLFADDIIGHHQTVIRGMPEYIGSAHGISGCTILDHGRIGLILDIGHIIDMVEKQSEGLPQQ